jgi:hypothetical protein
MMLGADAASPPVEVRTRHILVVENTENMMRQRERAADLFSRLILGGFMGRARPGDPVELWLLGGALDTNTTAGFSWDPREAMDRSNHAFRLFKDLRSKDPAAAMAELLPALGGDQPAEDRLLVYLATSGVDPMVGTPFDAKINAIFRDHGARLREARLPFVTVMLADAGKWVDHAVTPGNLTPFIPAAPTRAVAKPDPAPSKALPADTAIPAKPKPAPLIITNRAPSLSVEEITRRLQEAQAERARSNLLAAAAAAAATADAKPAEADGTPEVAPHPTATPPGPSAPTPLTTPGPGITDPPATGAIRTAAASSPGVSRPTEDAQPAPVVAAVPPPPEPFAARTAPKSPITYVVRGTFLLLAALALTVVLARQLRTRGTRSVITRSLEDRRPGGSG